ncbi:MAG: ABC transporter ATP-binding protein [Bdellovibrionota bacterium]
MIEVSNLKKHYGDVQAVKGISFSIPDGQIVGFLGPNGAGKTTTMRMLTTFLPASGGTAKVAGFDVARQSADVRRNLGYLPENPPLYLEMTVREYLFFIAKLKDIPRAQLSSSVLDIAERCGLKDVLPRLCGQLSKGYRQRVGLAQALIHRPRVIILDEPTSGLDPAQIIEIRRLIRELEGKHTVILSTHILPEVAETCSRVIIISKGRISVDGPLAEITRERSLEERFLEAISGEEEFRDAGAAATEVR